VGALTQAPNELIKEKLYKIKHDKHCLPYIDLAIGEKVMITNKLATQIGIYNCTTGIVVGFGFHTAIQEEFFPKVNSFHTLKIENYRLYLLKWINTLVYKYHLM
jgi:hypothetical protein